MIFLRKITKKYNEIILDNISLKFYNNNIYLIKGISGSGKTTLLNILTGIDEDYEGNYYFNNQDVAKLSKKEKKYYFSKFGYIFQKSLLISHLRVIDNLLFIKNDKNKILELAKEFDVTDNLYQMPSELSGGQRQRISIIRCLLLQPSIIVADEPTASLDKSNAKELSRYFSKIKSDNKIVIITSHSNVFDDIADQILEIANGKVIIKRKKKKHSKEIKTKNTFFKKFSNSIFYDFKYAMNKWKKQNIIFMLFLSIILFFTLLSLSIKLNFKKAYTEYIKKAYPLNTFYISNTSYNFLIDNKVNITKYEKYVYYIDNIEYLPLLPKENTILSRNKYLEYGRFPQNDNEVIVNYQYIEDVLKKDSISLGELIKIDNMNFYIVGVISKNRNYLSDIYDSNSYYDYSQKPQIFVPYESLKLIFDRKPKNADLVMITIDKYTTDIEKKLYDRGEVNYWVEKFLNIEFSLTNFLNIYFLALGALCLVFAIFYINQILLDLYYRKKEIGYLQLFGISQFRIKRVLLIEYIGKYIIAIIFSLFLYFMFSNFLNVIYGINIILDFKYIIFSLVTFLIYIIIVICVPLNIYLKKTIKKLIFE